MVSKSAQADIEEMWEKGLKPTVADIVRLNVLGLKLERVSHPDYSLFNVRRCAFLGEGDTQICLMQPTIAHDIWHDEVSLLVDLNDSETSLATDAYICFTQAEKLPQPTNPDAIKKAVGDFLKLLYPYTSNQIALAILYCKFGTDWMAGEYPALNPNKDNDEYEDFDSVSLGIMLNGIATGIGLSLAEAKTLTRTQIMGMISKRMRYDGTIDKKKLKSEYEDDYLRTLDEITNRLQHEKEDVKHHD